MSELSKLIEEMEAAGEGRTDGPWGAKDGLVHFDDSELGGFFEIRYCPNPKENARFIAFAGTHWQRILEALKQAQAENEKLRETELSVKLETQPNGDMHTWVGDSLFVNDGLFAVRYCCLPTPPQEKEPSND